MICIPTEFSDWRNLDSWIVVFGAWTIRWWKFAGICPYRCGNVQGLYVNSCWPTSRRVLHHGFTNPPDHCFAFWDQYQSRLGMGWDGHKMYKVSWEIDILMNDEPGA